MEDEEKRNKDWFKKHADTITILGVLAAIFVWTDTKFDKINDRLTEIEIQVGQIKTVLILKGIMPESMIAKEEK